MKVSINWLKELIDLNCSIEELINLLPLRSVSIKEVTKDSIELDMKGYNRADLLSMRGVALEVAAITNSQVKLKDNEVTVDKISRSGEFVSKLSVKIDDSKLCPVYSIAKIENLKVEQSNETWVKKLSDCGIRSINNVADVTNLIMLEYGQPMHAFDARAVKNEQILVRTAKDGERITTLDGKTRDLKSNDLLIADPLNAIGLAGVMGGKDSEVGETTTTILLEAAIFDPVNIKKTTTRLGLPSEASKRFQHGLTKKRLLQALDAAIKMYKQLGGKLTALSIVGDLTDPVKKVLLTQKKLNSLVGIEFKPSQVEEYLTKLGFKLASHSSSGNVVWEVEPPYYRLDIEIEEDVIEEVARMYGYEKIPAGKVSEIKPLQKEYPIFQKISDLRHKLVNLGLTEVQTYSFFSTDVLNNFNANKDDLIRVANPISSETEYLRDWLSPNLVEVMVRNFRKGFLDQAIFEIGKAYFKDKSSQPDEKYYLAVSLMNGSDNPILKLYQIWQKLKPQLNKQIKERVGLPNQDEYLKLFHPTRFIGFSLNGKDIGGIAEIHPRIVNKFGLEERVAILEIEIQSATNTPIEVE